MNFNLKKKFQNWFDKELKKSKAFRKLRPDSYVYRLVEDIDHTTKTSTYHIFEARIRYDNIKEENLLWLSREKPQYLNNLLDKEEKYKEFQKLVEEEKELDRVYLEHGTLRTSKILEEYP